MFGIALLVGCNVSNEDSKRILVEQDNELGVVAIEIEHREQDGSKHFELRGLDAGEGEVASVRLGIDDEGSLITIAVGGADTNMRTIERNKFELPKLADPAAQRFVTLDEVSSVLEREANMFFTKPRLAADGTEVAQTAVSCTASHMMTTPIAQQCCREYYSGDEYGTLHVNDNNSDGYLDTVWRQKNFNQTACRASNGTSLCSGSACQYGPLGYGKPVIGFGPNSGNPYPKVWVLGSGSIGECVNSWYATPQTPVFGNTTGTAPRGRGCCNGVAVAKDYDWCCNGVPSTTNTGSCVATGANPAGGPGGLWDY